MGVMEPLLQAKTEEGVCLSLLPLKDVFVVVFFLLLFPASLHYQSYRSLL